MTEDVSGGATPGALLEAIREACGQDPVAYARMLELVLLAGLDELQVIAGLPSSDIEPREHELPPPPPRRPSRRRR